MNRIKNIRPGVLVIPDAGLKLKPGQVVEVERLTKQIQAALKNGRLAMADKPKQEPLAPPEPDQDAEPVDLSKLSATDAISRVNEEANPETLKGYMDTEKRRTVIDALKSRLEGLQGGIQGVLKASEKDLTRVPGLGEVMARTIYKVLHE